MIETKSKYTSINFLVKKNIYFSSVSPQISKLNTATDSYVNANPTVRNDLTVKIR